MSFEATLGPCMRAWRRIARRCFFGMRRQMSQAVRARATGPAPRKLRKRATERSLALPAVALVALAALVVVPVTIVVVPLPVILLPVAPVGVVALTGVVAVVALAVVLVVLVALACGAALRLLAVVVVP